MRLMNEWIKPRDYQHSDNLCEIFTGFGQKLCGFWNNPNLGLEEEDISKKSFRRVSTRNGLNSWT